MRVSHSHVDTTERWELWWPTRFNGPIDRYENFLTANEAQETRAVFRETWADKIAPEKFVIVHVTETREIVP